MKMSDLTNSKNKNKVGAIIIVVAIFGIYLTGGFGMAGLDATRPLTDYASWEVQEYKDGALLTLVGNQLIEDAGASQVIVSVDWNNQDLPDFIECTLRDSAGTWVEAGEITDSEAVEYKWIISLESCSAGSHGYYVQVYANYDAGADGTQTHILETSDAFTVYNPEGAEIKDPQITVFPDDREAFAFESIELTWSYIIYSECLIEIIVNGVIQHTWAGTSALFAVEQSTSRSISIGGEGYYDVIFRITPVDLTVQIMDHTTVLTVGEPSVIYEDPVIIDGPDDQDFLIDSTIVLEWGYTFELAAVLTLYIDNVVIETEDYAGYATEQLYTYSFTPEDEADYTVKFELVPVNPAYITVIDEVVITGTLTTPTTTTRPTTEPPPLMPDYMLLGVGIVAVVIIGFIIKKKRSEY